MYKKKINTGLILGCTYVFLLLLLNSCTTKDVNFDVKDFILNLTELPDGLHFGTKYTKRLWISPGTILFESEDARLRTQSLHGGILPQNLNRVLATHITKSDEYGYTLINFDVLVLEYNRMDSSEISKIKNTLIQNSPNKFHLNVKDNHLVVIVADKETPELDTLNDVYRKKFDLRNV